MYEGYGYLIHKDHKYIKKERRPYGWRYWYKQGYKAGKGEQTDIPYDLNKEYAKESEANTKASTFRKIAFNSSTLSKNKYYNDLADAQERKAADSKSNFDTLIEKTSHRYPTTFASLGFVSGTIIKAGHDFLEKFKKK